MENLKILSLPPLSFSFSPRSLDSLALWEFQAGPLNALSSLLLNYSRKL